VVRILQEVDLEEAFKLLPGSISILDTQIQLNDLTGNGGKDIVVGCMDAQGPQINPSGLINVC
jgi:hypothetical protein